MEPWGQGPEVRGTLGPRPLGPWDLMCQGLKVRGPMGQGLMALESFFRMSKTMFCAYDSENANYNNDGPMIIMIVILMIMITKNDQIKYKC